MAPRPLAAVQLLEPTEVMRHEAAKALFQTFLHDASARLLALQDRFQDALQELATVEQSARAWDIRNPPLDYYQ